MVSKATLLHLRIPFSFYLLPFFLFALAVSPKPASIFLFLSFIIIHFLFYPSSNGYNSFYDKDEESIGGLEKPPPVSRELLIVSLILEALAILSGFIISWQFACMIFVISMVSRAYSHPAIRLKKYPVLGLITVALFQGAYTFYMSCIGMNGWGFDSLLSKKIIFAGALCSLMLFGSYPMTQIYQHGEDGRRGDQTMSRMLGIEGTFWWTGIVFFITSAGFFFFFLNYYSFTIAALFPAFLLPVLIYFFNWYLKVRIDKKKADFKSTMRLNTLSSLCFIGFFLFLYFSK
jgi:1,4-dihydroxy-2-naphthoate octaprenyltransferase